MKYLILFLFSPYLLISQDKGQTYYNEKELVSIIVAKAGYADKNNLYEVDGISGATITSNGVSSFLKRDLKRYEKYFTNNK